MGRKRARWLLSLLVASSSALVAAVPVRADQPPDHHGRVTVETVWVTPANEAEQAILRLRILNETPSLKFSLSPMAGRTSRTTPSITSTTGRLDGWTVGN
jgi:hypothetical protein